MTSRSSFDVFLSHNHSDKPEVEAIARRLADEGLRPWLDTWNLLPGDSWQASIEGALDASKACAVFLGANGIGSWENEEMRAALNLCVSRPGFRVIPVLLRGATLPDQGSLPMFLSARTWVDFRNDPQAFDKLVAAIRGTVPSRDRQFTKIFDGKCPYRGLEVFDETHEQIFFGRESAVQHLLERLSKRNLQSCCR